MIVNRRQMLVSASILAMFPRAAKAANETLVVPFRLTGKRILVDCTVAGAPTMPLVLDTGGAIGLLQLDKARALGLRKLGETRLAMLGGQDRYPVFEARDVLLGGRLRQSSAAFAGVETVDFGDGAVGSLSAGTLTSTDSELDFVRREWRLLLGAKPDRAGWTRFAGGISAPASSGGPFLYADARIGDGEATRLGLDTGMPSGGRLYRTAAGADSLWDSPRWCPVSPGGRGRLVRAPSITVAGARIEGPLLALRDEPGDSVFPNGLLGFPVLRLFDIATDIAGKAVLLRRNALAPDRPRYNMAGVWLNRSGKDVSVAVVGPGSPAATAGLRRGDRIMGRDFDDLLRAMEGEVGDRLPLTIRRGGEELSVELVLADYL